MTFRFRLGANRTLLASDHERSLARQHTLMDPALGAFPVPDQPPGPVFLDDLDRQGFALEDPFDRILNAGTGA